MQQSTAPHFDRYRPVALALVALYLVGCFSPLRLEYDSVRYFAIKDCLEIGCAPDSPAARDFLPYGYPVLLLGLSVTGLLNSFSIAFINGIFLVCSLIFVRKIMNEVNAFLFYAVVLLNWTLLKLFAYPLSEMQYLFFSAASLYCFHRYTKTRNGLLLLSSLLLAAIAVFTRTIGIALFCALIAGLLWEHRNIFRKKIYLFSGLTLAALMISLIIFALAKFPGVSHYLKTLMYRHPGEDSKAESILKHTEEWGQLFINMPVGKLRTYMPAGLVDGIFLAAGLVLLAWLIFALVRLRKTIPPVVIVYLATYSLVLFNWSFYDPRFWVPVLPFIAAVILQAPIPKLKTVLSVIFFAYLAMGIIAFGYSFYTQFNKKAFARVQANGIFRTEYEIHFFGKPLSDSTAKANPDVMRLLEKYDD